MPGCEKSSQNNFLASSCVRARLKLRYIKKPDLLFQGCRPRFPVMAVNPPNVGDRRARITQKKGPPSPEVEAHRHSHKGRAFAHVIAAVKHFGHMVATIGVA